MQKDHIDPAQDGQPDPSLDEQKAQEASRRLTPTRAALGVFVLLFVGFSIFGSLASGRFSSAHADISPTNTPTSAATTPTNTTGAGPSSPFGPFGPFMPVDCTVTATPQVCTPTPTPVTPTPVPPTPTPVPPTPTPTKTATPRPTKTATPTPTATASPTDTATVTPTDTATAVPGQTGGNATPGPVATSGPSSTGGNGGGQSGSGFPLGTILIVVFALLGLGLSGGVGWLLFRRMLMPNADVKVKPSGARPWSRTRVPNPDSVANAGMMNMNAAPAFNGFEQPNQGYAGNNQGYDPMMNQGYAPNNQGYDPMMNQGYAGNNQGYDPMMNQGYAQVPNGFGTPAAGFGGFSDGFVPPSPQVFPQAGTGMLSVNTGDLPALRNTAGYAPNSNAFNAMYGLPDDPFASSQAGGGWMDQLGAPQNQGFGGQHPSTPNNFAASQPDINDPYLAEVIRQYSQKGKAVQPPQAPQPEQRQGFQSNDWMR